MFTKNKIAFLVFNTFKNNFYFFPQCLPDHDQGPLKYIPLENVGILEGPPPTTVGVAASIGPFLGGVIVQIGGWRWVFAFTALVLFVAGMELFATITYREMLPTPLPESLPVIGVFSVGYDEDLFVPGDATRGLPVTRTCDLGVGPAGPGHARDLGLLWRQPLGGAVPALAWACADSCEFAASAFDGAKSSTARLHDLEQAKSAGYTFPYLYDETQAVAQAYKAACTPDMWKPFPRRLGRVCLVGGVRPAAAPSLENHGDGVSHAPVHETSTLGIVLGDAPRRALDHPFSLSSGFAR